MKSIKTLFHYTSVNSSDEEIFKEKFLISCSIISIFIFLFFSISNYILMKINSCYLMLLGGLIAAIILILFLNRKINFTTTVNIGLINCSTFLIIDAAYSGGVFSSGMPWIILFPFLSFCLLGNTISTKIWIVSSIFVILIFGLYDYHAKTNPLLSINAIDHAISYVALIIILFILTYIFEQKKQEKILQGEKQFRIMFEVAPIGITIFNSNSGGINDLNQKYSEIVGRSKKEIKKMGWEKFTHPDDLQIDLDKMAQLDRGEITGFKLEKRYIKPNGSIVWVDMIVTTFKLKSGDKNIYMCMIEDITQRKLLEEKQEIDSQILEEKSLKLANQNEQLNDFCDIVSHNLRAPLASIAMLADYIERCDDEKEKEEMVSKIKPVANNLNEIFNELVESLQIDQDHTIQSNQNLLNEVIKKITKRFEIEIELNEVEIILDNSETPFIYFPFMYLDSILSNLISNSIKYKFPNRKPVIKISTKIENDSIILSVEDNGLGIDLLRHKNNLFKIRKVFHDHPDAKGFGLFISKKQIEALGGKIWVESIPNEGTTFFVKFVNQIKN